ncbi:MAG: hypothetical protein ACRCUM_04035 [Mycoplasmoidaceae bacterium]
MNKKIKLSLLGTLIAGSALAITLPIVSCSSSSEAEKIVVVPAGDTLAEAENAITTKLKEEMKNAATFEEQDKLAKSWGVNKELSSDHLKIITNVLKFVDSGGKDINEDVIESVSFNSETKVESGEPIVGPKLKVNFKDSYTSKDDIIIQAGSLGNAALADGDSRTLVSAVLSNLNVAATEITEFLKNELVGTKTGQAQRNVVINWQAGSEIPSLYFERVKEILVFKDSKDQLISGDEVIESVIFNNNIEIPNSGVIYGPKLKVILKSEYVSSDDVLIQVGDLGLALDDISFVREHIQGISLASRAAINVILPYFNGAGSREAQQSVLDSFVIGEEAGKIELFFENFNFPGFNLDFKIGDDIFIPEEVIEKITFHNVPELPKTGEFISIQLKINFKIGYDPAEDFILKCDDIAIAL